MRSNPMLIKCSSLLFMLIPGQYHRQYSEGDSPIDKLQNAIHCYATAIHFKPKDAGLHLKLAMALEEKYYAEDMFGLKTEVYWKLYFLLVLDIIQTCLSL